jgi:type IV pilus assembly protein PilQ
MKHSQILKKAFLIGFLLIISGCATENSLKQTQKPEIPTPVVKISTIQRIAFTEEENYTRIQIEGSEAIAPPFYKLLSDPLRIAIDVPNIDLKQIKTPLEINNGTVGEVLATQYDDKGRIEISLIQMTNYNISERDMNLIIDIEKVKKIAEVKGVIKEEELKKEEVPVKETKIEVPVMEVKKEELLPASPVMNKAKDVVNVLIEEKTDFIAFNIVADGKLENYNSFKLDSPARLVLDIWGVGNQVPQRSIKIQNPIVKAVRIGEYPDKLRFVFDSSKSKLPPYQVNRIDDKLLVSLGNIPLSTESQITIQEKSAKEIPNPAPNTQIASRSKSGKQNTLTSIDFKQMDDKSRIVISFSAEDLQFESSTPSANIISIDVKDAFIPKHLLRGLDTSAFESAINYIDLKNVKVGKGNNIKVLVKLREETTYETAKEGKEIFIDIKEKPKKIETKIEAPPIEVKKGKVVTEVKREEAKKEEVAKVEETRIEEKLPTEPILPTPVAKKVEEEKKSVEEGRPEKVYTGRKLSLDFKDADIKNILRLIAEVSNLNIIAGDEVTGKITMRLVEVPWDQALEIILQSKNLGMSRVGNVIRIAPLDALKKEIQAELEAKRAKEKLEDMVLELIPINYASGKEILPQVKSVLSERGDVKIDERTNTLIIKDISKTIPAVKNLVKTLDTKTPQVLIEARIVEANLAFQRDLGISWGFLASGGEKRKVDVGGGTGSTTTLPGPGTSTNTNKVVNLPALVPAGGAGAVSILEFLFTSDYGLKQLDIAISAYEDKGDAQVISSPKIATLDNKEASIEQGLRIPYTKYTAEGTATEDFIDANLKLTVTPHVTNDGNIRMAIKVKKDAPDYGQVSTQNTPRIDKKEAITEVLIKDNGVIAIAGIYTIEKSFGTTGVPLFNKIPLLGWLFKKQTKGEEKKDLLIFISPKIIKDQV